MSALGRLAITLGLDAAEFTNGLTKAEYQANKFAAVLGSKIGAAAKTAVSGLTLAASAGAGLIVAFDQLNKATGDFQDFAEKTGTSAEALASFKTAVDVGGGSIESLAGALNKLTKGLAGADEETKGAAQAVKALGFSVEQFQQLDPAQQYEAIAFALAEFEDGAGKTAAAMALMGKSGADQLPVMKALVEQGGRQVVLTQEMITQADEYADKQALVRSQITQLAQAMATQALPVLNAIEAAFRDVIAEFLDFDKETKQIKDSKVVEEWAMAAAKAVAFLIDAFDGLQRVFRVTATVIAGFNAIPVGNWEGTKKVIADIKEQIDSILMPETFGQKLQKQFDKIALRRTAEAGAFEGNFPAPSKKQLDPSKFGSAGADKAADAARLRKAQLDQQLSDLDNFIKGEERLLQDREQMLERLYQSDQLSIAQYFEARNAAIQLNLKATTDAYDKQIEALEAFAATQKKAEERIATQSKIADFRSKRDDSIAKANADLQKLSDERSRATQQYQDQVSELTAKLLELEGAEKGAAEAAIIRFDIQNRAFRRRAAEEGDTDAIAASDLLRKREGQQAAVNGLLKEADVIQSRLQNTEQRLFIEREIGLRGELSTLTLLGQERSKSVGQLQDVARRYKEIADASNDPVLITQAEAFNLKLQELAESADTLGTKLRSTFTDAFADAFDGFVRGTLSAKEAFRSFANDVLSQINRMLANELATAVFGKGSTGGDAIGGIASAIAGIFTGGGFADGGFPPVGKISVVGERGPELFVPRTAGMIIPNHALGGSSVSQNITFVLPTQITRTTQNQIASRTLIAAQRAVSRGVAA